MLPPVDKNWQLIYPKIPTTKALLTESQLSLKMTESLTIFKSDDNPTKDMRELIDYSLVQPTCLVLVD